jgi:Flp pilus assembly protein TadG
MALIDACKDETGAAAIEFGLTAPAFLMLLTGTIVCGLLVWTQLGLQHGAERAARCASINTSVCGTTTDIQNYASQQAFGLNPPASTFTVSTPGYGNQVSASYTFNFLTKYFGMQSLSLSAQSCFPK